MIRFLDVLFTFMGIVLLIPIFIIVSILIKLNSKGPVYYKQIRVGLNGKLFSVYKFRTMYQNSDKLGLITVGGRDPRVTSLGYILRKYKLDELPQLFNVLIGEMSIVGPRPEVKKYTDLYNDEQLKVLKIKPGITDWASIIFSDENELLATAQNPEEFYIKQILPEKIKLNLIYLNNYSISEYFKIIFTTLVKIFYKKYKFHNKL